MSEGQQKKKARVGMEWEGSWELERLRTELVF